MSLVVPNAAKINRITRQLSSGSSSIPTTLKLFQNNYTPVATSVLGDLTEATFSGYSSAALTGLVISGTLDSGGRAFGTWGEVSWTKLGLVGNDIYGYWVIDGAGVLLYLERFDGAPISMQTNLNQLRFTPQFTLRSQFGNT